LTGARTPNAQPPISPLAALSPSPTSWVPAAKTRRELSPNPHLLDVQRMRLVRSRAGEPPDSEIECEVLVVGGGMGGAAAALAAARAGRSVLLTEETDWLGGQMTAQGVSALDEHRFIESFGSTASYAALRRTIREIYRADYHLTAPDGAALNPG